MLHVSSMGPDRGSEQAGEGGEGLERPLRRAERLASVTDLRHLEPSSDAAEWQSYFRRENAAGGVGRQQEVERPLRGAPGDVLEAAFDGLCRGVGELVISRKMDPVKAALIGCVSDDVWGRHGSVEVEEGLEGCVWTGGTG